MNIGLLKIAGLSLLLVLSRAEVSSAALFSKKHPPGSPAPTNPPPVIGVVTNTPPPPPPAPVVPAAPGVLTWESDVKTYAAKAGELLVATVYYLTNTSPAPVVINSVVTSCGCTTAQLPPMPWTVEPGANGEIGVNMNLAGKTGTVIKTITVNSTAGNKMLQFQVTIPDPQMERSANQQLAAADRQAVFKGSCVSCHVTPGEGKKGAELYNAVCGVCHEATHRASMVPDLKNLPHPTSRDHWRAWITGGKPGSLMPAFQKAQGGPLSEEQIDSLVEHLTQTISAQPKTNAVVPAH